MEKPNARGPSPSRKAEQALGRKLNRKSKTPPLLPPKKGDGNSARHLKNDRT